VSRAALALAAALLGACGGGPEPAAPAPPGPLRLAVGDAPRRGPDDAWVTVIEFSDFQCPYCAGAQGPLGDLLRALPADVRVVYRHYPLARHLGALSAAEAAECARLQGPAPDGHFWAMHDAIFAAQARLAAAEAAPGPLLAELAGGIDGLDPTAWSACMAANAGRARVDADVAMARPFLLGTPTFVVNGTQLNGASGLRQAVDAALAWAERSGIPRSEYYDRAVLGL